MNCRSMQLFQLKNKLSSIDAFIIKSVVLPQQIYGLICVAFPEITIQHKNFKTHNKNYPEGYSMIKIEVGYPFKREPRGIWARSPVETIEPTNTIKF